MSDFAKMFSNLNQAAERMMAPKNVHVRLQCPDGTSDIRNYVGLASVDAGVLRIAHEGGVTLFSPAHRYEAVITEIAAETAAKDQHETC